METLQHWGLVGHGTIGRTLAEQLAYKDGLAARHGLRNEPLFVMRSDGEYDYRGPDKTLRQISNRDTFDEYLGPHSGGGLVPDVLFVALPSTADGELAMRYIRPALERGKLVVTAEKGALANHYEDLRDLSGNFAFLRHNATVGGGTGLIEKLRIDCVDPKNINELHVALNGTLTYVFSEVGPISGRGSSFGEAVDRAQKLGYAEPGMNSARDVIREEAEGDTPKKVSILFNRLELSDKILRWQNLSFALSDDDLEAVETEATERRFITSIYPSNRVGASALRDIIGMNITKHDGWTIVTGFPNVKRNPLYRALAELGAANVGYSLGIGSGNEEGQYSCEGPGAGPKPTTKRMLADLLAARKEKIPDPDATQQWLL